MEYSVEELKNALIERCEKEGILYATVAMDRRTKEMILPDTLEGALKHPEYFVCTCRRVKDQYIVEEITSSNLLFLFFFFYSPNSPSKS
jgi:hypothetical protein